MADERDLLARLPGEIRNSIYDLLINDISIRHPRVVVQRPTAPFKVPMFNSNDHVICFGGESAGLLHVNNKYGDEFLSIIHHENLKRRRVDLEIDMDGQIQPVKGSHFSDPAVLLAHGAAEVAVYITVRGTFKGFIDEFFTASFPFEAILRQFLVAYYDQTAFQRQKQQITFFIQLRGPSFSNPGFSSSRLKKLYWKLRTGQIVQPSALYGPVARVEEPTSMNQSVLQYLAEKTRLHIPITATTGHPVPSAATGLASVFIEDPSSPDTAIHTQVSIQWLNVNINHLTRRSVYNPNTFGANPRALLLSFVLLAATMLLAYVDIPFLIRVGIGRVRWMFMLS